VHFGSVLLIEHFKTRQDKKTFTSMYTMTTDQAINERRAKQRNVIQIQLQKSSSVWMTKSIIW